MRLNKKVVFIIILVILVVLYIVYINQAEDYKVITEGTSSPTTVVGILPLLIRYGDTIYQYDYNLSKDEILSIELENIGNINSFITENIVPSNNFETNITWEVSYSLYGFSEEDEYKLAIFNEKDETYMIFETLIIKRIDFKRMACPAFKVYFFAFRQTQKIIFKLATIDFMITL